MEEIIDLYIKYLKIFSISISGSIKRDSRIEVCKEDIHIIKSLIETLEEIKNEHSK